MKKSVIKFFDKIIIVILGFSGLLYSCAKYGMIVYYGDYEIKGVITDKETSKPIQNIKVGRETYTDAEGKYILYGESDWAIEKHSAAYYSQFRLIIEDIDGEQNDGEFISKEIDVIFTQADQVEKGNGKSYQGKFVKIINVELNKENQ